MLEAMSSRAATGGGVAATAGLADAPSVAPAVLGGVSGTIVSVATAPAACSDGCPTDDDAAIDTMRSTSSASGQAVATPGTSECLTIHCRVIGMAYRSHMSLINELVAA